MDSIDFDNVKAEKSKALHRIRTIGFLFRVSEICAALLFVCWIFTCLPFAVQISAEFLRRLSSFVSTPLFMFFLGNSIVVALLTTNKSTVFSAAGRTVSGGGVEADIYEAFIRSGENRVSSSDGDLKEEIIDKQMITITDANSNSNSNSNHDSDSATDSAIHHPTKVYRRSKSDISAKQSLEMVSKPALRRSETGKCRKTVESCEEVPLDENYPEDHMTNEEFQKTIEAFIAKQLVFRRRESLAVVIHNKI